MKNRFLLIEKRKKNNWTQEYIAKKAKVSRATVNNWEAGKTVPFNWELLQQAYQLTNTELLSLKEKEETKSKIELPSCFGALLENMSFSADMCDLFLVLQRERVLDKIYDDAIGQCIPDKYFFEKGRNKAKIMVAYDELHRQMKWCSYTVSRRGIAGYYSDNPNWFLLFLERMLYEHPAFTETGFSLEDASYDDLKWYFFADLYMQKYALVIWNTKAAKSYATNRNTDWLKEEIVDNFYYGEERENKYPAQFSLRNAFATVAKIGISGIRESILYIQDDGTATILDANDIEPIDTAKVRMKVLHDKDYVHGSAVPTDFVQIEIRSTKPAWETWCELKKVNPELPEPKLGSCEIWHTLTPKGIEVYNWMERNNLLSFF